MSKKMKTKFILPVLISIVLLFQLVMTVSCTCSMQELTTLKAKVIDVTFIEDIYEDGCTVAYEEIECEIRNGEEITKVTIINNDYHTMNTIKANQYILLTIKKTEWISSDDYVIPNNMIHRLEIVE